VPQSQSGRSGSDTNLSHVCSWLGLAIHIRTPVRSWCSDLELPRCCMEPGDDVWA
jgi:hypothetical protein